MESPPKVINPESIALHRAEVKDFPNSRERQQQAVEYFLDAGLPGEALTPLARLIELTPDDCSVRLIYGATLVQAGQLDAAEQQFLAVVRRQPTANEARHNLGVLYFALGREDEALLQFKDILSRQPENAETLNDLAVLYAASGEEQLAEETFNQCLVTAGSYRKGWTNALDFAWQSGRFAWGQKWINNLSSQNPGDPELQTWRERLATTQSRPVIEPQPLSASAIKPEPSSPGLRTVSVIIPVHDQAESVVKSVESLLQQNYQDLEVVVVDDGSTDDLEELLTDFGDRITYFSRVHRGWAAAVNEGLQRSCGEWLVIINPGDLVHRQAVSRLVETFVSTPAADVLLLPDEKAVVDSTDGWPDSTLPAFRRSAFGRLGFFPELGDDLTGRWSRRLLAARFSPSSSTRMAGMSFLISRGKEVNSLVETKPAAEYHRQVLNRAGNVHSTTIAQLDPSEKSSATGATGMSILVIGHEDPGGMYRQITEAINRFTPHECRIAVHQQRDHQESPYLFNLSAPAGTTSGNEDQLRDWASKADWLIFLYGAAPGSARRDFRLENPDQLPWGTIDWRTYLPQKKCAAIVCSSPSVRGNYRWYAEELADRGWPVFTTSADIHLNIPTAEFILPVIDWSAIDYERTDFDAATVGVVFQDRPEYAGGNQEMFSVVARRIKNKYGAQVQFGTCAEMSLRETLQLRRRAHIGFDRLSFGASRFGLTSLENSALGLVNVVYLDPFTRALLAQTLATDELPWLSPDSDPALYRTIDALIADRGELVHRMRQTSKWFRRYWSPEKVILKLTAALENRS